jgi:dipeptidyl aminopeptidase/acylaminoacyl peptidase
MKRQLSFADQALKGQNCMTVAKRTAAAIATLAWLGLSLSGLSAALAQSAAPPGVYEHDSLALSPSGDRVATVDRLEVEAAATATATRSPPPAHGQIVVRSVTGGREVFRLDPCAACTYDALAWAPDGKTLAFIATDQKAGIALLEVAASSAAAPSAVAVVRTVARILGVAGSVRWSPDGTRIAFLAVPDAHKQIGATQPGAAQVGDLDALDVADEQRIGVVETDGGPIAYVSPADTFVYEYSWTPDGEGFVATAAKGNGDNNWWAAKLLAIDARGRGLRVIASPTTQLNFPTISADGRTVAFIGGLMSDLGSVGGDIYTVPFAGGAPVDATPGFRGSFTSLAWRGQTLFATALIKDRTAIAKVGGATGAVQVLRADRLSLSAGDGRIALSADGSMAAAVAQDFEHAPAIYAGPIASWTPVTHDNADLAPQVEAHSVNWSSDGFDVQGWLLAPLKVSAGLHPMVVVIHGGPSSAAMPTYVSPYSSRSVVGRGPIKDLMDRGYFVLLPNPRGSYGQGEAFTRANIRDFGGGDLRDILAGVDAVERIAPIDDKRLGVMGHSYGGFMTMWTVTHSQRFKAAIAGAGISDWISYYGENGIDAWMAPFFGATAYDDPAIYAKLSPLSTIKDAHTPTFLYVGERDVECPEPQTLEFWRGLKAVGVPTRMIVYAGEGHGIRQPADYLDLQRRELGWLDGYLGR